MPDPLLESVPNVSVGRDEAAVRELVAAIEAGATQGGDIDGSVAQLADVHRDADHDRTVFTVIGCGEALAHALEQLARRAVDELDVHAGRGVHPCIGVVDVLPIIPMEEGHAARAAAHALARRLAVVLGEELHVPTIRYGLDESGDPIDGAAATGLVRRGGASAVASRVASSDLRLHAGPTEPHPTAGMTICGVRDVLVAFNVRLEEDDLDAARAIARRIRESTGAAEALPGVRALGLQLASRGTVQISTNVERHATCGPARVLEAVHRIAAELGVAVAEAELVGLAPETALAQLRYACTRFAIPLQASAGPSLDRHVAQVASMRDLRT